MEEVIEIDLDLVISQMMSDNYTSILRKLATEIVKIRNLGTSENINFSELIVSVKLLNAISDIAGFHSSKVDYENDDTLKKVGSFIDLDVYVDFELPSDEMLMTIGKANIRDNKLNTILYDSQSNKFSSVRIKVKSSVI